MAFKTVLTIAGLTKADSDLKQAIKLCEEANMHLSVLVVALAAPPPIGQYTAVVSDVWAQERQADMEALKARTADVSRLLAESAVSADVTSEYPELAWADEAIGRRGRYADVTLIGAVLLAGGTLVNKAIEGALFSSGRPLLLVPEGWQATLRPRRVVVAWDARIEASRAVHASLDLLIGANEVRLVLVDPVEGRNNHGAEPGADVATWLTRHGVKVAIDRLPSEGHSVADVLRRHASDCAADLLVMGAYGHSRMRERLFGGVTKSMLAEPPLPIFMAR